MFTAAPSPRGFDCSGFMYYLYGQYGYSLWRGAGGQWNHNGTKVDKSDLQPGDLVFFSDSVDPIGHVGMYIGDNQFIHASSGKGCVVITSLSSSYYANHYTGRKAHHSVEYNLHRSLLWNCGAQRCRKKPKPLLTFSNTLGLVRKNFRTVFL